MSMKSSIKYVNSKDFMFHLYYCFVRGYCIDIRFKDFNTTFLIDKEQAEQIEKELNGGNKMAKFRMKKKLENIDYELIDKFHKSFEDVKHGRVKRVI